VAGSEKVIEIRQLSTLAEFEEVERLQQTVWGFDDRELLPARFIVVANRVGGHIFGAYEEDRLVGFCLALPGLKPDGCPYLHSHMLAVLPKYRNGGVGRRLKLRQREDALARGLKLIEWTFNPLELKNAFLNIERLGAIVRRYLENQYGASSSPLDGGLPTDRCVAEWWIATPRVAAILAGEKPARRVVDRIPVPGGIARIRREESGRAREILRANAARFHDCFARGLAVTGFDRTPTEGIYLLEAWL
jgi:predicted GNAT superfamily acetyltransferase